MDRWRASLWEIFSWFLLGLDDLGAPTRDQVTKETEK